MTRTDTRHRLDSLDMVVDQIQDCLEHAGRVMVVSHIDPDGDALGTQLAFGEYLRDLGKDVVMVRDSAIPDKYLFLPDIDKIVPAETVEADFGFDTAVILECPTLERVGSARRFLKDNVRIVNIDHHRDSSELGTINWIDLRASSVGEMAYEYFAKVGYQLNDKVAVDLYTAIMTDTGRFRYESTTPRTMTIAGELIARGANPRTICNQVYFDMLPSTMLLTGRVLATMEFFADGRVCIVSLTRKMLEECNAEHSESDGLVDFTLYTRGVTTGALVKEVSDNVTKVSLRSSDGVNVSDVATQFGGGGHFNAAGCTIQRPYAEVREKIIAALTEACDKKR